MIRFTVPTTAPHTVIRLDGRLEAHAANELRELVLREGTGTPIELDLSGLTSTDPAGLSLLLELQRAGHSVTGGSLYVNRLLSEARL